MQPPCNLATNPAPPRNHPRPPTPPLHGRSNESSHDNPASPIPPVCAIGLDIGGTKTAAGIVEIATGRVHDRRVVPTLPQRGGSAVLEETVALVRALHNQARARGWSPISAGIGVPELVNATGQIASAATLAWSQLDAHTAFNQILPARFEADSRAAALAEARFGAGRNLRSFLYLTIGTGIGASLVLDGAPYRGARGLTGTIASSAIEIECPRCHASVMLSVEDAASGSGLMRRFRERTGRQITTEQLLAAAEARSNATTDAVSVVLTGARALGAAVAAAVNMLDPEAVIVGGGLGLATGLYHNTFAAALRAHIWSDIHRDLPLLRAALGLDAGLVGAALSAAEFELARVPPPVSPPVSP